MEREEEQTIVTTAAWTERHASIWEPFRHAERQALGRISSMGGTLWHVKSHFVVLQVINVSTLRIRLAVPTFAVSVFTYHRFGKGSTRSYGEKSESIFR